MARDWGIGYKGLPAKSLIRTSIKRLGNFKKVHERIVIQLQAHIFKKWPTKPGLSGLTKKTRRGGSSEPLLDSGKLRLSMTGKTQGKISTSKGTLNKATKEFALVGSDLIYAGIHNLGGTIRATKAKNLAIPVTKMARKAGSPRNFPKKLDWIPSKKRDVSGVLISYRKKSAKKRKTKRRRSKAGKTSNMRRGTIHYILKPSVKIPQRRFLPTRFQAHTISVFVIEDWLSEITADEGKK